MNVRWAMFECERTDSEKPAPDFQLRYVLATVPQSYCRILRHYPWTSIERNTLFRGMSLWATLSPNCEA